MSDIWTGTEILIDAAREQIDFIGFWQPIATAPKDKTKILSFGLGHGNGIYAHDSNERPFPMFAIAYWDWFDGETEIEVSPGLYRKESCRQLEGWRTEWSYTPTHWMPLPSPPK